MPPRNLQFGSGANPFSQVLSPIKKLVEPLFIPIEQISNPPPSSLAFKAQQAGQEIQQKIGQPLVSAFNTAQKATVGGVMAGMDAIDKIYGQGVSGLLGIDTKVTGTTPSERYQSIPGLTQMVDEKLKSTALKYGASEGFAKGLGVTGALVAGMLEPMPGPKGRMPGPKGKAMSKTFQGLPDVSTKLLEKFRGMPEQITEQQFNEVINRSMKEGIRKADLDLVKEMAGRQSQGGDLVSRAGSYKTEDEFIKAFDAYQGGVNKKSPPPHAYLSITDLYPGEWDNWTDLLRTKELGITGMLDSPKKIEGYAKDFDIKKFDPVLVRKYPDSEGFAVEDGHHRVVALILASMKYGKPFGYKGKVPVFFDRDTLGKIWKISNGTAPSTKTTEILTKEIKEFSGARQGTGNINLPRLASDVQSQLVPLTPTKVKSPRWSNVGEDFIGDGKYGEVVYQSPVKTSAGDVHFQSRLPAGAPRGVSAKDLGYDSFPNYFSHVRFEDMADGKTRKLLETQSDLFQKGSFEREVPDTSGIELRARVNRMDRGGNQRFLNDKVKEAQLAKQKREAELSKLQPYNSNDPLAHLRTFREEVKRAAKDGKDTLLIPSGETAMKIEGLGNMQQWRENVPHGRVLTMEMIEPGLEIRTFASPEPYKVIKNLGNGRFIAAPRGYLQHIDAIDGRGEWMRPPEELTRLPHAETFDISGKVDTKHFVYKLNEEAIPKEARRMGLQVEKLESLEQFEKKYKFNEQADKYEPQTPGSWWKITIPKEQKKLPTHAFAFTPLFIPTSREEE